MITARIQENWQLEGHEVLLKERRGAETSYLVPASFRDGETFEYPGWRRVPATEAPGRLEDRPLYLPPGVLEAIIEAGARHIGPDIAGAVDRHLQDAIATRDMLLEVVRASAFDRIRSGAALERSTV